MKPELTKKLLKKAAKNFCEEMSKENHPKLIGITDGKAVGTYVEHRFKEYLQNQYVVSIGNSAKGIDLPDAAINTDIKVTSKKQPQSSCPFSNARQKIYGLGYNLLIFVYKKHEKDDICTLQFTHCTFVKKGRTADYTITKRLLEMIDDDANLDDIIAYLRDRNLPGEEIVYRNLAKEILKNPPKQGYLTISTALQWRLQYSRVISLGNTVPGVTNYEW